MNSSKDKIDCIELGDLIMFTQNKITEAYQIHCIPATVKDIYWFPQYLDRVEKTQRFEMDKNHHWNQYHDLGIF